MRTPPIVSLPGALPAERLRRAALVLTGSLVVALSAQVAIPLPFSPVPLSLQTAAVALVGATLGWRLGAAALLAYLAQGLVGLPVFAGGAAGPAVLLGPRGGYLLGFVLTAVVAGWLVERGWGRGPLRVLALFLLAGAAVYLPALPVLALFVGPERAVPLGLLPFLPGDLVKMTLAAVVWLAGSRLSRP